MSDFAFAPELTGAPAAPRQSFWRADVVLMAAAVFLSPINYLRADFAYITLSDVFLMMSLVVMYAQGRVPLAPFGQVSMAWYCSVFLLAFGLLVSSAIRGDLVAGLTVVGQYCFSLLVVPLLLLQRSRAEVLFLIKVFVAAMVFVMLHGSWYMEFAPKDFRFVTPSGRMSTLVERENAAAALAAIAITFSLWLYFTREIRLLMLVVLTVPLAYGLLQTGSNTGFFLTVIGAVCLALFSGALRLLLGMAMTAGLLVFVTILWGEYFLPDIFVERVMGALETGNMDEAGTFSDRMYLIHEAYGVTRRTIWIGLGADQYRTISAHGAPVHNTYLLLLAEGGIVSLLGHFGLMATGLMIGLPMMLARQTRWYGVLTITIIIMLALVQNGLAHFYARFWAVPWFLALAISLAPADDTEDEALPQS
ncbi:O-antigen ligase family protein [Paracoccus xiamenensis]|uniref:O-antigen ligase family protein n=1 Tax=Paracoccus xiamenensis TaxID=2714901 RepID=UPI00140E5D66|nr:O-antigen ligase family protein [Paracoccus xiamenensis]NHF73100.1 hypothetical protein [Paracoccus xiamenensis]